MQDRQTVYRIKYTFDNRVKAVHTTQEPVQDPKKETFAAWFVIALGALAYVGWWHLWA